MVANLKEIRKSKGMTQEALARAANIHRITISKYEAGKVDPSLDNAGKLAEALGVKIDDLIGKVG